MKTVSAAILIALLLSTGAGAQTTLTWQQLRDRFEAANPTLKAAQLNIDESRAAEITAYLRPNPDLSLSADGTQLAPYQGVWRPLPEHSTRRPSAICTNGKESASCAATARRSRRT